MAKHPGPRWPNAEKHVRTWLADHTGRPVYTETPARLAQALPAYQVTRVGGADTPTLGKSIHIEVDTIAADRGSLWEAAGHAQGAMEDLAANGTAEWYVDEVTEIFSPAIAPYENPNLRRATATYALTVRPR